MQLKYNKNSITMFYSVGLSDHKFALEPEELRTIINEIRKVESMSDEEKFTFINNTPNSEIIIGSGRKSIALLNM